MWKFLNIFEQFLKTKNYRNCEIARENDLAIPEEIINGKSAEEIDDVYARCLRSQHIYLTKIELGKQVATIVENRKVLY